jgi:glycosyltransferase involved in cell wall biosynthesis
MGMSDIFAHPAEAETWGLVINEALAAGLPLLVSDDSGAAEDLVTNDAIGKILRVGDIESWKRELSRWCALGGISQMGVSIATKTLAEFSMETAARRIEEIMLQHLPRS